MRMVWELVHSMNQAEILRFREIARTRSETPEELAYVKFFSVLLTQAPFDKKKIKESLFDTSTLKRLGDSLCYLYHALLKALQSSNDNLTKDVSDLASQMQVLLHKGLYHHIPILGKQAMAFAIEIEDFEGQLKLLRLERSSYLSTCTGRELGKHLEKLDTEEDSIRDQIENLHVWERLISKRYIAKSLPPNERMLLLNDIERHPFVLNQSPTLSSKAEIARLSLNEKLLSVGQLDVSERIPILMEVAEKIATKPSLLEDVLVVERFLYAVFNAGVLATMAKNEGVTKEAIEKLEWFSKLQPEADVLVFERVELIKFIRILDNLDLVQGQIAAKRIKKGFEGFGERLTQGLKFDLLLFLAYFYLITGKVVDAIKLLHPFLESVPTPDNPKRSLLIWIFFLMAHFERDNIETLASHSGFAKNYLKAHKLENEVATLLFDFFDSYSSLTESSRKVALLKTLDMEIQRLFLEPSNAYFDSFQIGLWTKAKTGKYKWLQLIAASKGSA
jgi:hypothetical protein